MIDILLRRILMVIIMMIRFRCCIQTLRRRISRVTLVRYFLIAANWFYLPFEKHEFFAKVIAYQKQLKHHVWVFSVLPKKLCFNWQTWDGRSHGGSFLVRSTRSPKWRKLANPLEHIIIRIISCRAFSNNANGQCDLWSIYQVCNFKAHSLTYRKAP